MPTFKDPYLRGLAPDPDGKRIEVADDACRGLRVRVNPSGSKVFIAWLSLPGGKAKTITLGTYTPGAPAGASMAAVSASLPLGLADARRLNLEVRAAVLGGRDPVAEAKAARAAVIEAEAGTANVPTLEELIGEYEKVAKQKVWTKRDEAQKRIRSVFHGLLARKVDTITAEEFSDAVTAHGAVGAASRGFAYLKTLLNWASGRGRFGKLGQHRKPVIAGIADLSVIADPQTPAMKKRGRRTRLLSPAELKLVWATVKDETTGYRALMRWIILTAPRFDEAVDMRWRYLDLGDEPAWTKPDTKNNESQRLPLPAALASWLKELPSNRNPDARVFANSAGGPISNPSRELRKLHKDSGTSDWTAHDLRRTLMTHSAKVGIAASVADAILGHKLDTDAAGVSAVAVHYQIQLEDEQRKALAAWARWVDGLLDPAKAAAELSPLQAAAILGTTEDEVNGMLADGRLPGLGVAEVMALLSAQAAA